VRRKEASFDPFDKLRTRSSGQVGHRERKLAGSSGQEAENNYELGTRHSGTTRRDGERGQKTDC